MNKQCFVLLFRFFEEYHADLRLKNMAGCNSLLVATMNGDIKILERLAVEGMELDETCGHRGVAAVHIAAISGHFSAVKFLIDSGADINVKSKNDETILWLSTANGHEEIARYVIRMNCDLNVESDGCLTFPQKYLPFEVAILRGHLYIAQMLLTAGCYLNRTNDSCSDDAKFILHFKLKEEIVNIIQRNNARYAWMIEFITNPKTLLHDCRLKIRQLLGKGFQKGVSTLPLPNSLKLFLFLPDI